MARIPLVESDQAEPRVKAAYEDLESLGFSLLNVMKMFGNHADINEGFVGLAKALYGDPKLSARYRELAYLRASQINNCHY